MDFIANFISNLSSPAALPFLIVIIFALSFLGVVTGLISLFRSSSQGKIELPPELGRASNIMGRIEKLEQTLNSFRTDSTRSSQLMEHDMKRALAELESIRKAVGAKEPEGTPEPTPEAEPETTPETEPHAAAPVEAAEPEALSSKLTKTRSGIFSKLKSVFQSKPNLDDDLIEELEAVLVGADLGVGTTTKLMERAREELTRGEKVTEESFSNLLKSNVLDVLTQSAPTEAAIPGKPASDGPRVVVMVGVNGVGKTTTSAKLASKWKDEGASVMMVAADTFRAAAVEQLAEWGERIGVPVVKGSENAKPSSVVFDAMEKAIAEKVDVLIIDTAGRLHTKSNLMQELEGVRNVIQKHIDSAPHETILVVDGSTGQNALTQAREFNAATPLTGLVVTKLDGTPKGGIVVAIKEELGIPVRYIGVGEASEDLRIFDAAEFAEALFDTSDENILLDGDEQVSAHGETRRRRRRRENGAAAV